jgi:membrane dipeptidase
MSKPTPGNEEAETARRIHEESLVLIIHDHNPLRKEMPAMMKGGVTGIVHQLTADIEVGADFLASADRLEGFAQRAFRSIDRARRAVVAGNGVLALSADDIEGAKRDGKPAIILGNEGGKLLEGQLGLLQRFHRLGLREMQLTWAVPNQLCRRRPSEMGLTDFGRDVVREMNRLGMLIDVSHLSAEALIEVLDESKDPVVLSHGNPGAEHPLDLHKAMCEKGGVFGQHFYHSYLGWRAESNGRVHLKVEDLLDAIDYAVRELGVDHVALGGDYFPSRGQWASFQRAQGTRYIEWAVKDISKMPELTRGLVASGYSELEIRKLLGGNLLRLCRAVFGS